MWGALLVVAAVTAIATAGAARDRWLSFGAATLVLTSIAHSVLGERFILRPLVRRSQLPKLFGDELFLPRTVRFVWHLFSILLLGLATLLLATTNEQVPTATFLRIISATAAACAVVAAAISRGRHLSWLAFSGVAVATWLAGS